MEYQSILTTIISILLLQLSIVSKFEIVEATSSTSGKPPGTGSSINGQIKLPTETNVGATVSSNGSSIGKEVTNAGRETPKLVNDVSKATETVLQATSSTTQAAAKPEQNLLGQISTTVSSNTPLTGNIGTNSQVPYHQGQDGRTEYINYGYSTNPSGGVGLLGSSRPTGNARPGQGMIGAGNWMNSQTEAAGINPNGRPGNLGVAGSAPNPGNGREGGSGFPSGGFQSTNMGGGSTGLQNGDRGTGRPIMNYDESQSQGGGNLFSGFGSLLGLNAGLQIFGSGRGSGRPVRNPSSIQNRPPLPPIGMNANGRDQGGPGIFPGGFPPVGGVWGSTGQSGIQAGIYGNFDYGSGFAGLGQNDGRFQNYGSGTGTGSSVPNRGDSYSYSWSESFGDTNNHHDYNSSTGSQPGSLNNNGRPINQNQPGHISTTGNGGSSIQSVNNSPKIPGNSSSQSQSVVQHENNVNNSNSPTIPVNKPQTASQQGQTQLQANKEVTTGGGQTSNNNQKTKP